MFSSWIDSFSDVLPHLECISSTGTNSHLDATPASFSNLSSLLKWVQMDATLSYAEHITNTVSACMASLSQINRVKHIFDTRTLLYIINALVFSKLYYCSSVLSNTSKKNICKLQSVQNFAARIVSGIT